MIINLKSKTKRASFSIIEVLVIISILATVGYAKTTTAANKLNNSPGKPAGLPFLVKPV